MKTRMHMLLIILLVVILAGCATAKPNWSDTYNRETDYPYMFHMSGQNTKIAPTGTGYYVLNGQYIYYADKETMNPVLLDGRPDSQCLQETPEQLGENCTAYVDVTEPFGFIAYYNDKVYTLQNQVQLGEDNTLAQKVALIELARDGKSRKTITSFDYFPQSIAIHRGHVYYTARDYSKDSKLWYGIKSFALNQPRKTETWYIGEMDDGQIQNLIPYGKQIYFTEYGKKGIRDKRLDLQSKTVQPLFPDDQHINTSVVQIRDDQLYFSYFYGDVEDERSHIYYETNLSGGELKKLPLSLNFLSLLSVDEAYYYTQPVWFYLSDPSYKHIPHVLDIYDLSMKKVDQLDMSAFDFNHKIVSGDDRYLFVLYKDKGHHMKYMDKEQIGKGRLAWTNFIETLEQ